MFDLGIAKAFKERLQLPVQEMVSTAQKTARANDQLVKRLSNLETKVNQVIGTIGTLHEEIHDTKEALQDSQAELDRVVELGQANLKQSFDIANASQGAVMLATIMESHVPFFGEFLDTVNLDILKEGVKGLTTDQLAKLKSAMEA